MKQCSAVDSAVCVRVKHQEYVHEAVQRTAQCVRALNEVKERQVGAQLMFQ